MNFTVCHVAKKHFAVNESMLYVQKIRSVYK